MKRLLVAAVILFAVVTSSNAAENPRGTIGKVLDSGTLTLMQDLSAPPWQFRDSNGRAAGVTVDLSMLLASKLGVDLKVINTEWAGLIPGLMAKKADVLLTTLSTTWKRAQRILYIPTSFYSTGSAAMVNPDSDVTNWQSLNSPERTVTFKTGTVSQEVVELWLPKAKKMYLANSADTFEAVRTGRADAVIEDLASFSLTTENYNFRHLVEPRPLIQTDSWAFAVRPGDVFTWQYIDFFTRKIIESGELDVLLDYWANGETWVKDYTKKNNGISDERKNVIKLLGIEEYEPYSGGTRMSD